MWYLPQCLTFSSMAWWCLTTGDSHFTCFYYPCFQVSAILFSCHKKHHQYPSSMWPSFKLHIGPLRCMKFHWLTPLFWLQGLQIKASLRKSTGTSYISHFMCFWYMQQFTQIQTPHMTVTCTELSWDTIQVISPRKYEPPCVCKCLVTRWVLLLRKKFSFPLLLQSCLIKYANPNTTILHVADLATRLNNSSS